jgi:hypothetical protein
MGALRGVTLRRGGSVKRRRRLERGGAASTKGCAGTDGGCFGGGMLPLLNLFGLRRDGRDALGRCYLEAAVNCHETHKTP